VSGRPDDFRALLEQARDGVPAAAELLLERYGAHVLRLVRRRLPERLRSQFDSLDFTQDVWASFFADAPPPEAFASADELVNYLLSMAHHKVARVVYRRFRTTKHDIRRERSLEALGLSPTQPPVAAVQPTASQVAIGNETWDQLVQIVRPADRVILLRLREGCTHAEVAAELGLSEKTVQRVLQRALSRIRN
jgi:RNA polymerase sigma-70 factor (ECF subfamily)